MSVLVHGEEKRESVVRELHGVGLEHREARAVRHDDVVGAPCARALRVADRDRVASAPRRRRGRGAATARNVRGCLGRSNTVDSTPPFVRGVAGPSRRRVLIVRGSARARAAPGRGRGRGRRSWLHCCDACDAGAEQGTRRCSVIFRLGGLRTPGGALGDKRAASPLAFLSPELSVEAAPASDRLGANRASAGPASLRFRRSVASLPLSMCGSDRLFFGPPKIGIPVKTGFPTRQTQRHRTLRPDHSALRPSTNRSPQTPRLPEDAEEATARLAKAC